MLVDRHIARFMCSPSRLLLTARQLRRMSTFALPDTKPAVSVQLTPDLSQSQLVAFPAFKIWLSTLKHSLSRQQDQSHEFHAAPYLLRKIEVQATDFFGGGRLGFVKLRADVSNDHGEKLPGSVFLRGGSVGMLVRNTRASISSGWKDRKYSDRFTNATFFFVPSSFYNPTIFPSTPMPKSASFSPSNLASPPAL